MRVWTKLGNSVIPVFMFFWAVARASHSALHHVYHAALCDDVRVTGWYPSRRFLAREMLERRTDGDDKVVLRVRGCVRAPLGLVS